MFSSIYKTVTYPAKLYQDINPATLSGAIDIIVVKQKNGDLNSSPFHVRFGKIKIVRPSEKSVLITVNGVPSLFSMKLGDQGEAFFVVETNEIVPHEFKTSPIISPGSNFDEPDDLDLDESNTPLVTAHSSHGNLDQIPIEISEKIEYPPLLSNTPTTSLPIDIHRHSNFQSPLLQTETFFTDVPDTILNMESSTMNQFINNAASIGSSPNQVDLYLGPSSDKVGAHEKFKHSGPLSDTEIEYRTNTVTNSSKKEKEIEWSWNWGGFPIKDESLSKSDSINNKESSLYNNQDTSIKDSVKTVDIAFDNSADLTLTNSLNAIEESSKFMEISTCGLKEVTSTATRKQAEVIFQAHIVSYQKFCENPMFIVENPQVVIKIGDRFYNWATASPIIASLSIFHKLPNPSAMDKIDNLLDEISTPKDSYSYRSAISSWFSRSNSNQRSTSATPTTPSKTLPTHLKTQTSTSPLKPKLEPLKPIQNYAKALRLSSDELKSLNLNPGSNTITFTVASSLYGSVLLSAKIFLWDWDSKVVISDIDGTITKSDALGHLFHMVGKDWTHSGVASLYTNITKNGYKILYLTSRAIGQASTTRDYLKKVEQGDVKLPEGPMIMSPDRLFRAFHREVILRKPEEFKIACLKDVKRLFRESSPFYAGFGNRITDAISYKKVDVPVSRIFTIDPSGKIQLDLLPGYESSYIMLNDLVDQIFPPITVGLNERFNDLNFWKGDMPSVNVDELLATSTENLQKEASEDEYAEANDGDYEDYEEDSYDEEFADVQAVQEMPTNF